MPSITSLATSSTVLIESDWNLKIHVFLKCFRFFLGINRIRLEFKVMELSRAIFVALGINRIRLEFKV